MGVEVELNGKGGQVCKHAKIGEIQCPLIIRPTSEDVITGNVFGSLKHIRPHLWLGPILNIGLDTNRFRQVWYKNLSLKFWEKAERYPPELLAFTEGRTEPDIAIEWENPPTTLWIEVKYLSPLAAKTRNSSNNDQAIRGIRTLLATTGHIATSQLFDGPKRRPLWLALQRLFRECTWTLAKHITPASFTAWRSAQSGKAAKTLNEYLDAVSRLLNWMVKQNRIPANPLVAVGRVETRGQEKRLRRALTEEEVGRLLAVAGARKVVYLLALYTGLRRDELQQLRWSDVQLDADRPVINARASTTKNHRVASFAIHPVLLAELRAVRPPDPSPALPVLEKGVPSMEIFRLDLEQAGIAYKDELGRQADFHALRKTLNTMLARQGVPIRVAMELMRHSDAKLTTGAYTDAAALPVDQAIHALPAFDAVGSPTISQTPGCKMRSQILVTGGPAVSQAVLSVTPQNAEKTLINITQNHDLTLVVTACQNGGKSWGTRIRT